MATLAAFTLDAWAFARNLDARVLGELEVLHFLLVARGAGIHAHVLGAGNHRRGQDPSIDRRTGDGDDRPCYSHNQAGDNPCPKDPSLFGLAHGVHRLLPADSTYLRSAFGYCAWNERPPVLVLSTV